MGGRLFWGFISWVVAGLYWLIDRLYGDAIFSWMRPMIPPGLANPDNALWLVASFGPPTVLFILGAYFFFGGRRALATIHDRPQEIESDRDVEPTPTASYETVILRHAIAFRDGIVRGRLEAATNRLKRGDYAGMIRKIARETLDCPELDEADPHRLLPHQTSLLSEYRYRVREFRAHVNEVTMGRWNGTEKEAAQRFHHTLNMASQRLDKLISQWNEPEPTEITIKLKRDARTKIGNCTAVLAVEIARPAEGQLDLNNCLVKLDQFDWRVPEGMPMPLVLRTEGQVNRGDKGPFRLRAGERKTIPILYQAHPRRDEWFVFDELGKRYFLPSGAHRMLVGIYGARADGRALIKVSVGTEYRADATFTMVSPDYSLDSEDRSPANAARWPRLTPGQRQQLRMTLANIAPMTGVIAYKDSDFAYCEELADDLRDCLCSMGWTANVDGTLAYSQKPGIEIRAEHPTSVTIAEAIEQTLSTSAVRKISDRDQNSSGEFCLLIGRRPNGTR